mmetsp:Transcript_18329/g.26328  ORF Transcript_18329/g.26328 Transcript_18329/m.26328 type:complete len:343 (-) Transcript_18329:207-1235(-)
MSEKDREDDDNFKDVELAEPKKPAPTAVKPRSKNNVVSAMGVYCFSSISMVLANKSLASSYNGLIEGNLNVLLVVFQAIMAVVCVEFCKRLKWVEYPAFSMRTARLWAPVNILFCLMLVTGMGSLQHNSVPMVTIFKNITNMVVTIGDYFMFGNKAGSLVFLAFAIMLSGAVASVMSEESATWVGILFMVANCMITASYILYMKVATKTVKLSKFGMVFYNNILCTLFLLPIAIFRGEVTTFLQTADLHSTDYLSKNIFAGFIGFFLNFASLNFVAAAGPTTYAIVGSVNKVPVAILGYLLFDDVINLQTWFFITLSMCGGFLYSYAKIRASRLRHRAISSK